MFDFKTEVTELIREAVYSHLNINHKRAQAKEINCRCFICGDSAKDRTKKRGWIYFNAGDIPSYYCWNEGCNARGISLLAKIKGITAKKAFSEVVQRYRATHNGEITFDENEFDEEFIIDEDGMFDDIPEIKPEREEFIIPADWHELDERCKQIIDSRKIMEAPFAPKNWKLYLSAKHSRIIVPWIKDGNIIGHQLRAIYKTQTPKYKFEKGHEKPIFGLDMLDYAIQEAYLIEGVFDSIFVKNGLAIGGIQLSQSQKDTMQNYMFEHVYMLDNQWVDPASKKETLKLLNQKKSVFIWPKKFTAKDVNEHVVTTGENPFKDPDFLKANTYKGAKGILRFKFNK